MLPAPIHSQWTFFHCSSQSNGMARNSDVGGFVSSAVNIKSSTGLLNL